MNSLINIASSNGQLPLLGTIHYQLNEKSNHVFKKREEKILELISRTTNKYQNFRVSFYITNMLLPVEVFDELKRRFWW